MLARTRLIPFSSPCPALVRVLGVAVMASPLRTGQVVKGMRDVYIVAQKLHDQVWSARSVPLSTPTAVIRAH